MKNIKKKIIATLITITPLMSFCQSKDSFSIRIMNTYDSNGNVYGFEKKYDHLPTREDTISYFKESRLAMPALIKEFYRMEAEESKNKKTNAIIIKRRKYKNPIKKS